MITRSKLGCAAMISTFAFVVAVSVASANRLSVSNKAFRVTWAPLLLLLEALSEPTRCSLTMEGSFHSASFVKTAGALIGHVYKASVGPCEGEIGLTINQEALPWHVRYRSFTGTLPNLTGILLGFVGVKLTLHNRPFGTTCVTTTTATDPLLGAGTVFSGAIEQIRADETAPIPLRGSFFCEIPGNLVFAGSGTVRQTSSTTRIRLTLI